MEITCECDHFTLRFWSGSRGNQILVSSTNEEVDVSLSRETWKEWFTPGGVAKIVKGVNAVSALSILFQLRETKQLLCY